MRHWSSSSEIITVASWHGNVHRIYMPYRLSKELNKWHGSNVCLTHSVSFSHYIPIQEFCKAFGVGYYLLVSSILNWRLVFHFGISPCVRWFEIMARNPIFVSFSLIALLISLCVICLCAVRSRIFAIVIFYLKLSPNTYSTFVPIVFLPLFLSSLTIVAFYACVVMGICSTFVVLVLLRVVVSTLCETNGSFRTLRSSTVIIE